MDLITDVCSLRLRVVQGPEAYRYSRKRPCTGSSLFSMDSDLEAFSHNPTHDSFAALPFQATAITNYVNQRFLSY